MPKRPESNYDRINRYRRWRLTESGREELARIVGQSLPERVNKP